MMNDYESELLNESPLIGVSIADISMDVQSDLDNAIINCLYEIKIDPDCLLKTAKLNNELQVRLRDVIKERDRLIETCRKLEAELNAAINDLSEFRMCNTCKINNESVCSHCYYSREGLPRWEWRGVIDKEYRRDDDGRIDSNSLI